MDLHNSFDHMFSGVLKWNQIWSNIGKELKFLEKKYQLRYILPILVSSKNLTLLCGFHWQFAKFCTWEAFNPDSDE